MAQKTTYIVHTMHNDHFAEYANIREAKACVTEQRDKFIANLQECVNDLNWNSACAMAHYNFFIEKRIIRSERVEF